MKYWTVKQLADHFGLKSRTAIHKRANRFAGYLSPTAQPGDNREFTPLDVAIMGLVHELAKQGRDFDAIEPEIKSALDRGEFAGVNDFPAAPPTDAIPASEWNQLEARAHAAINQYELRTLAAEDRAVKAEARAAQMAGEIKRLENEVVYLREQLEKKQNQGDRDKLLMQIGELRAQLRIAQKGE